ncbi:MAG: WecB/TagA/CpsF family glycosyltransferase [Thermomicrobiales bacterium]
MPRSLVIFGVRVDDVTEDEAVALCERFVAEGRRSVVTPNPEIVLAAGRDRGLRHALARADLAIPDGGGLLLAARWWGRPFRAQVRGSDLTNRLLERAVARGWRVFFLGGAPGVARRRRRARWSAGRGCALQARSPGMARSRATRRRARRWSGRGESISCWWRMGRRGRSGGWRAIYRASMWGWRSGWGVLDFLSGRVPRAPRWMREAHLGGCSGCWCSRGV